jgi:ferrous iron transport protein A
MSAACPLSLLAPGETSTVARLAGGHALTSRMAAIGLCPGATVTMLRNGQTGPLIVMIRNTRLALGRGEARSVWVDASSRQTRPAGSQGGTKE